MEYPPRRLPALRLDMGLDTSWWRRGSCPPPFDLHEELGGCLPDGHGPGGVGVYGLGQAAGEHAGLDGEGGLMDEFAATGGNDGRPEDPSPTGVSQDEPGTGDQLDETAGVAGGHRPVDFAHRQVGDPATVV